MAQLNTKAMNILYCSLDINEFNKISLCTSVNQIWKKLKMIYGRVNQEEELSSQEIKEAYPNLCLMAHEDGKKKKKKR